MRGLRSTLALLVVLIGLGAYIYFAAPEDNFSAESDREEVFTSLEAADIQELKVKAESGEVTTLRKQNDTWQIVEPIWAPAEVAEVTSLTSALGDVEIVRVIDENPADPKQYGLGSPRLQIDFKGAEGKPSGTLLVGDKTPTGEDMYARRNGEPRVFLIPAFQDTTLNRTTFDLRDKTLLTVDREKVDGIELTLDGKPAEFAKKDTEWAITGPLNARADFGLVEELVGRVQTAEMKSVVTEAATPPELDKYGFDSPQATVSLKMGDGRATLIIGDAAGEDAVYARAADSPAVVTVESALAKDVTKPVEDYRRKDIFEFRAFNATRAEITRGDQTLVLERVKGEGESPDSWRRVSPNAGTAEREKVETLLTGLADIRAVSFASSTARTGLDRPAMTVFVTFEDGKEQERVSFGQAGDDVYASIPGETGAAQVDAAKFKEAVQTFEELLQ